MIIKGKTYFKVLTWDADLGGYGGWTPQYGVRSGPYTQFGLRKALRKLRGLGYTATRDDNATLVESYIPKNRGGAK